MWLKTAVRARCVYALVHAHVHHSSRSLRNNVNYVYDKYEQ